MTDLDGIATVQVKLGANPGTVSVSAIANGLPAIGMTYNVVAGAVPRIYSGAVVGAGLSLPAKRTASPSGIATIFGSNFAPAGTAQTVHASDLVNGNVPTSFAGIWVEGPASPLPSSRCIPARSISRFHPLRAGPCRYRRLRASQPLKNQGAIWTPSRCKPPRPSSFFFQTTSNGQNPIAAVDALTGAYIGSPGLVNGVTTSPATVNQALSLFGTSFGATNPPVPPGTFPAGIAMVTAPLTVTLGGAAVPAADVLYAGAAPGSPGLFQLNLIVPPGTPDGDLSVSLTIGGVSSPAGAYLTVKSAK